MMIEFPTCKLLNISYCPATEKVISVEKSLVVVAYNPLGWYQTDFVRIPVNDDKLAVRDSDGNYIATQLVEVDNITSSLRRLYVEAYLGVSPKETPKVLLTAVFFGVNPVAHSEYTSSYATMENETIEIGPGPFKLQFSSTSGQLKRITNHRTGVDIPINQSFLWYEASSGDAADGQASGAYIFRPDGAPPVPSSSSVPLKVIQGPLVDEVHQQFNSWIYQVIRVYKEKEHAEIEFTIGPIPTDDGTGKEVITRLMTNMVTNSTFYTDSNGRDFLKRVRDYRADWNLQVTQPVSGNYYPLNLGIYSTDGKSELSVLVDRAVGGSSIKDGEIEIMLHRRLLYDDSRGVAEALDEQVCVNYACEGLTDEESWKSSHVMNATTMDHGYNLPPNVAIITLQDLHDGSVLLRLAHLYEAGEDVLNSRLSNVDLKKVFAGKTIRSIERTGKISLEDFMMHLPCIIYQTWYNCISINIRCYYLQIKELRETNLSANQDKSGMKTKKWRVADDPGSSSAPIRGRPVDNTTLVVELGPMEIRTFLLKF
ncbi:hypothetical protein ZIOFF_022256 [Zingiber officinale]|uniref:Glycosyl hydrolase family 38 C-terminal domain-containing protein n=1 Tax=Zingiber officinale TaxID=94328 RepID=A0A8J5H999_ZINOF|nr:hypothetical protein ZIOFF_022256 [Zingiber officinale]